MTSESFFVDRVEKIYSILLLFWIKDLENAWFAV